MRRHDSLKFLSQDHHHGLMLAQLIRKGAPEYRTLPNTPEEKKEYTIQFYRDHLSKHFSEEENILFPFIKGKNNSIDEMIYDLIKEHNLINDIIITLDDNPDFEIKLDRLGGLLNSHIRKEERELFPKIQQEFNEKDLLILQRKLKRS